MSLQYGCSFFHPSEHPPLADFLPFQFLRPARHTSPPTFPCYVRKTIVRHSLSSEYGCGGRVLLQQPALQAQGAVREFVGVSPVCAVKLLEATAVWVTLEASK